MGGNKMPADWQKKIRRRIGRTIREKRLAAGWSLQDMVRGTGLPFQSLRGWETGVVLPRIERLIWLCMRTGWRLADLLGAEKGIGKPPRRKGFAPGPSRMPEGWQEKTRKRIGAAIRRKREAEGWSVNRLAQVSGFPWRSIYNWESGKYMPPLDRLIWLCLQTGWNLKDMFKKEEADEDAGAAEGGGA